MRGAENVHMELFSLCGPKSVRRWPFGDHLWQPAVRNDASVPACWWSVANFCHTVQLWTSSGKRTLISCQLELITRFVFYCYYNPLPSTDFIHTYPQFSIYVQFCRLWYLVSCIRGFKYVHLGKISVCFAPLDWDLPEQVSDGIYRFSIIIAIFWHFVAVFCVWLSADMVLSILFCWLKEQAT